MSVAQKYDSSSKKLFITVHGPFNFSEYSAFRDAYRDIDPKSVSEINVDLQKNDYIDSSALGMLLLLEEHFPGCRINILNCSVYTKQVLEIARFEQKFNIS